MEKQECLEATVCREIGARTGGEILIGVVGPVRTGKSTLITHMNGLNKPTSGHIIIDGRDLWAEPEKIREFRFLTGLVFQYPEYQLFEETCYKDIAFGPRNMGLDEAEIDRRVHEAADFVGLDEALLQRSPFELSGGQKRRVAVAGVMAMKPRILVLDEPAAGMNPSETAELMENIVKIRDTFGIAIMLIEHDMSLVMNICEGICVLNFGKVIAKGTAEEIQNNDAVIEAYLGKQDKGEN